MSSTAAPSPDVVVVGAGIVGAATAWRLAQRGLRVTTVDPDPTRGAWRTAAGMLAPVTELHFTETPLLRLNLDSLARYPGLAAELGDLGLPTGYRETGTLAVAWDGAGLAGLADLQAFVARLGVDGQLLTGRELRELEPSLAPGLPGALLAPGDHQVDPRLLHAALVEAGRRDGVRAVRAVASLTVAGDRVTGVRTGTDDLIAAGAVVLTAGAWSGTVEGLPGDAYLPVRPVKGQTVRLRLPGPGRLRRVLRGTVKGSAVYAVPRADGRIVVGASVEEAGFDVSPRAGAVYELLRDAQSLVPELGEAVLEEVCTGLRPGSPDNAPLIGHGPLDGLVVAAGHHRNGILLTPVTADAVAELVTTGSAPAVVTAFSPDRFARPGRTPVAAR